MKFNSTDAWLLQSIYHSQGTGHASIKDVIAFADYVNHAVMTYHEFSTSLSKLTSVSLVSTESNHFKTTDAFEQWRRKKFKGKKSVQPLKELFEIEKYLNMTFADAQGEFAAGNISPEQYREAVNAYKAGN
jgi:hypothetical protein